MKKEKKNKFYKNLWFWLIIGGVLLFVINILVLVFVKDAWQSAWLTFISGWVSGFATIALGLIAFWQNKRYKIENDAFLNEQQRINAELAQEQSNLLWRKSKYDIYKSYRNEFLENEKEFIKYSVPEISFQIIGTNDQMRAIADTHIIDKRIKSNITHLFAFLIECDFYCEDKEKLFNLLSTYLKNFEEFYPLLQKSIKNVNVLSDINGEFFVKAHVLMDCEHEIEMLFFSINSHICRFIRKIYENEFTEVKSLIEENMDLQTKWLADIRQAHKANN